jgi:hypothetical protein
MKKVLLVVSFCILLTSVSLGQWLAGGHVVCDTSTNGYSFETFPVVASDGAGGVFVCWQDLRAGNVDLYLQHISASGEDLLPRYGIPIVDAPNDQIGQSIIADTHGRAYVVWSDNRGSNTYAYAQRIDSQGRPLWAPNGVKAGERSGLVDKFTLCEKGGVIVEWSTVSAVMVQRLDSLGNRMWGDSGVVVTQSPGTVYPEAVTVTAVGDGGAIVGWAKGPTYSDGTIYVQRIDGEGNTRWQRNGVPLTAGGNWVYGIASSTDGSGGALVSWANDTQLLKSAQRVDSTGVIRWTDGGMIVGAIGSGGSRRHTADGLGGAFIGHGRYVQHIDSSGKKLWSPEGVRYTTNLTVGSNQARAPGGGIWNFWENFINGVGYRIYGQWIDSSGNVRWGENGITINTGAAEQRRPNAIEDGKGGAYVCWEDFRSRFSGVYFAKVETTGVITAVRDKESAPTRSAVLDQNYPNPFNPQTTIGFTISEAGQVLLEVFDTLGRKVETLMDRVLVRGNYQASFHGTNHASGVYIYRLRTANTSLARTMMLIK